MRPVREASYACFSAVTLNVQFDAATGLVISCNGGMRLLYLRQPRETHNHEAGADELNWLLSMLQPLSA